MNNVKVELVRFLPLNDIISSTVETYYLTKLHRKPTAQELNSELNSRRLFNKYYLTDDPLMERSYFEFHITGFPYDFLTHIGRDTKFFRLWAGSFQINPEGYDFYDKENYFLPESIIENKEKLDFMKYALQTIQDLCRLGESKGLTTRELKGIMPMWVTVPLTASFSYRSLKDLCDRRICFHTNDYWKLFVKLVKEEIETKVDKFLANNLGIPQCLSTHSCSRKMEQYGRLDKLSGEFVDPLPLCPLYIEFEHRDNKDEIRKLAEEKTPNWKELTKHYFYLLNRLRK